MIEVKALWEATMFFKNHKFDNISPDDLREKMEQGRDLLLLDVRTPAEHASQAIEGSYLIPVQELAHRVAELPRKKEIVVYCRVGNRSAFASAYLARLGFDAKNLEGGIAAWSMTDHASLARVS
jgi:rhodanese-related sulfurtransferase